MSKAYFTGIRYINGSKYRFEPSMGELADLERKPFVDHISDVLEGMSAEKIAKAVAIVKARHEAEEDARIAKVQEHHALIRKNGLPMDSLRSRWHTTNRG
jgi:hypothetical protein